MATSCGTLRIFDHDIPDFSDGGVYPATKADFRGLTSGDLRYLLVIIDIPIALIVDTFFLPRDLMDTEETRFRRIHKNIYNQKEKKKQLTNGPS